LIPISVVLKPAFVFKSGVKLRHAPEAHELKGTGIKVPAAVPEEPLARAMREDARLIAQRESMRNSDRAAPERATAAAADGLGGETGRKYSMHVGGKAPPISALSQRAFGLRQLRK
jgi:hypothetical protein